MGCNYLSLLLMHAYGTIFLICFLCRWSSIFARCRTAQFHSIIHTIGIDNSLSWTRWCLIFSTDRLTDPPGVNHALKARENYSKGGTKLFSCFKCNDAQLRLNQNRPKPKKYDRLNSWAYAGNRIRTMAAWFCVILFFLIRSVQS